MLDISALEPKIAEAAKLMEMLSQPVRLRLMCILQNGEQSVLSLADSAGLSQPAMSHHLKKLRDAKLVETRRDGQNGVLHEFFKNRHWCRCRGGCRNWLRLRLQGQTHDWHLILHA